MISVEEQHLHTQSEGGGSCTSFLVKASAIKYLLDCTNKDSKKIKMDAHHESFEPAGSLALCRREFGEYGGVNASVESSTTFTVLEAKSMPEIFSGQKNPDIGELSRQGC
jgi:hypothetical protein